MAYKNLHKPTNTVQLCLEAFVRQSDSIERSEGICKKTRIIVDEILLQEPGLAEVKINRITQAFVRMKISALVTKLTFDNIDEGNLTVLRLRMIPLLQDIRQLLSNITSSPPTYSGIPINFKQSVGDQPVNFPDFWDSAEAA